MSTPTDLSECANCLCLASRRAARAITRSFDKHLRPQGIRITQFSVLSILATRGPLSISDLADRLDADRTTLTRNLALLESRALVKIRTGEDARTRIVAIAPKGESTLARALPAWRKAQYAMTELVGNQVADSLRQLSHSPLI